MNKITNQSFSICAIDASTNNIAFAFYVDKKLDRHGKINLQGNDIYQKTIDATAKTKAFFNQYKNLNAVVIEHTVFMNSPKTAADLALVQGAIIGGIGLAGIKIIGRVSPITWQSFLGNKKLTKEEQLQIRSFNPDKSVSWYKAYERDFRKKRTIKLLEIIYDKKILDYDVADAAGIGHWAVNNWEKAVKFDKDEQ
jgi:Holliday junction resolvasome RuvABC endonuclease subunit